MKHETNRERTIENRRNTINQINKLAIENQGSYLTRLVEAEKDETQKIVDRLIRKLPQKA